MHVMMHIRIRMHVMVRVGLIIRMHVMMHMLKNTYACNDDAYA